MPSSSGQALREARDQPLNTPFGFWIWCEVESNNKYVSECHGSMYFYGLGITRAVEDAGEDAITELSEGIYSVSVVDKKGQGAVIACTLTNESGDQGPESKVGERIRQNSVPWASAFLSHSPSFCRTVPVTGAGMTTAQGSRRADSKTCASIQAYATVFRRPEAADPVAVTSTHRAAIMSLRARMPEEVVPLLAALANSPDPVFVTDRHNHIVFWNLSAERILGYSAEEVVGLSCAGALQGCDIYGNRYCSETCPVTQIAVRNETVRHFDLRFRSKDQRTVAVDVSILNLAVRAPDHFLLVHVLRPSQRPEAPERPVAEAVSAPRSPLMVVRESPDARARKLTGREVEVIGMLAAGHTTPEIAFRLHISTLTARNHIQNVLEKLEVHSKAEAVAFAFQKHLL